MSAATVRFWKKPRWDIVIIDEAHNVAGASSADRVLSYRLLQGDTELFDRLITKVEEINRSTRTGESVLRLYDLEAEEEFIARHGLLAGDAEVLQRADAAKWDGEARGLEALLLEARAMLDELMAATKAPAPAEKPSGRLRLYLDRDFLTKSYDYLRGTTAGRQQNYQPLTPHLEPGEKCFCFSGQVSSRAGIPLIADADAISFLPQGGYRHRPLKEALDAARFHTLVNIGRESTFNAEAMKALIKAAVESSLIHLNKLRDRRRTEVLPRLQEEESRLDAWYQKRKSLQQDHLQGISAGTTQEQKLKREIGEMDDYVKDRNTHWRDAHFTASSTPVTRLILVVESTK